jgi:hypothetical protein
MVNEDLSEGYRLRDGGVSGSMMLTGGIEGGKLSLGPIGLFASPGTERARPVSPGGETSDGGGLSAAVCQRGR